MSEPTLTEFLLARIAEDEAVAKAAADGDPEWEFRETAWHSWNVEARGSSGDFHSVTCDSEGLSDSVLTHDIGAHIARHDPARVLAKCKADRQIVELYVQRANIDNLGAAADVEYTLEDVLRLLALPYAGHPDFREEWKS